MSGQSQHHGFRKPGTATPERPAAPYEKGEEGSKKQHPARLEDYGKKAEILSTDPNVRAADAIRKLDGSAETAQQLEGLTALNQALLSVLTKLAQSEVDISKIDDVRKLKDAVNLCKKEDKISLTLPEEVAMQNLERVLSQSGPTAAEIRNSWLDRIRTAQESWSDKYLKYLKKNPVETVALTVAGAAGIYLTYQGIKSLIKAAFADEKAEKGKSTSWFKKEILIPLAIMVAGAIIGKDTVKKILMEVGLDYLDVTGKIDKAKEFLEEEKDKLREAGTKLKDTIIEKGVEAAISKLGQTIKFDEMKAKLIAHLPVAPQWLKDLQLSEIAADLGIDPEKTDTWKEYASPGGAALLFYHWVTRKRKKDKILAKALKAFAESQRIKVGEDKEEEKKPEKESEQPASPQHRVESGIEMVPLKEAWKNYTIELRKAFADVTKFVKENPGTVTVGAIYLQSFESVRAAELGVAKTGFDGFVELAKIPFKTIKNYPISTLFAVSAIIAAESTFSITDRAGNIMVPKDPENLKKYVVAKMTHAKEKGEEWIKKIPAFSETDIDQVIETILNPTTLKEYIGKAEEVLANLIEAGLDKITLSREKLVQEANYRGFDVFSTDVSLFLQPEEKEGSAKHKLYTDLLREIESTKLMLQKGSKLSREYIAAKIKPITDPLNIQLTYDESGYLMWSRMKEAENGLLIIDSEHPPKRLAVDPDLPLNKAADLAQKLVVEESTLNALGKILEVGFVDKVRMIAGDILFEDAQTEEEAGKILKRKLSNGWVIAASAVGQLMIFEPAKGIWHKYASGPFNVLPDIARLAAGSKDVSATEVAIEYGQGIIPVYLLGQTSALLRLDFAKMGIGRPLFRAAIYPVELAKDATVFTFRHVILNTLFEKQPLRVIFSDPKMAVYSEFKRFSHSWSRLLGRDENIRSCREVLAQLYEAKKYLHQAIYKTVRLKSRREFTGMATKAANNTGEIGHVLERMRVSSESRSIRNGIEALDSAIDANEAILEELAAKKGSKLSAAERMAQETRNHRRIKNALDRAVMSVDDLKKAGFEAEEIVKVMRSGEQAPRGVRYLRNAEYIRDAARKGLITVEEAAAMGVKAEAPAKAAQATKRAGKAAENADDMLRAMEEALDAMEKAKKSGQPKTKIYEAVQKTTSKALEALAALGKGTPTAKLRVLEVLKIANSEAKVLEASAEVTKLLSAVEKAEQAGKPLKAAQKGKKLVQATEKLAESRKFAEATKDAVKASRKGFLTTEEAAKLSVKIERVAAEGGKVMKYVRIGGRVLIVVDAALSVYDVYDQACELGKVLSEEYVETGSILKAMDNISEIGETTASTTREQEAQENQKVIKEEDLDAKLRGARELASRLRIYASEYATSRRVVSGDSTLDKIWSTGAAALSELAVTPSAMRVIYGPEDSNLRESENKSIEVNIRYATELADELKKMSPQTPEITATVSALEASVELANRSMRIDEAPSEEMTAAASEKIDYAKGQSKKSKYIFQLGRMATQLEDLGGQEQLVSDLRKLEKTVSATDYKSLHDLDEQVLQEYNRLVLKTNEVMLRNDVVLTAKNRGYIINAYVAMHQPDLARLTGEKELWKGYKKDSVFIEHCTGIAEAIAKPGMTVGKFDELYKQNFSERLDDDGKSILLEANILPPEGLDMAIKNGYPTFENYLWDPKTYGYILGLCNHALKHPDLGSSAGAYVDEIKEMLRNEDWRKSTPEEAQKGGTAFFNFVKKSLKERGLESPEKYFGYDK